MSRLSLFPPYSISEASIIAKTIFDNNGGNPMRRLTLFDSLGRSPESSTSRGLITASSGYGLTQGGYAAEEIKLTERGKLVVENNAQALLDAVLDIDIFKSFYEKYKNTIVPSDKAAIDFIVKQGLDEQNAKSCLRIIIANGEQLNLIQEISGSKRIVSVDHAIEKLIQQGYIIPSQIGRGEIANSDEINNDHPVNLTANNNTGFSPNLHIDIQIHIAADAKPEQIEKIFESMAKYLYGRE
jgi:hypothetical protein